MDRKLSSSHLQSNRTTWNFVIGRLGDILARSFPHRPDFFQPNDNCGGRKCSRASFSTAPLASLEESESSTAEYPAGSVPPRPYCTYRAGTVEITGGWDQDAVVYHLLGPTAWPREGVIRPVLDNSHTAFPQIPETLFAVLLAVGGDRAPYFSSWLTLGLLLLISAGLAMRMGLNTSQGCWVAAIVAIMPAVYAGSHNCFVDGLYAAFVLAAARIGFDAEDKKQWAIFGIFCGLAMGTKYTGLLAVPALAICCAFVLLNRDQLSAPAKSEIFVWGWLSPLVASPFYLRNWILHPNPFIRNRLFPILFVRHDCLTKSKKCTHEIFKDCQRHDK
jgi:dolichyl-phosphate-mannose-protein mannosyltransferase